MATKTVTPDGQPESGSYFIIEKGDRLHLAVAVAEYDGAGAVERSGDELRRMFRQGRRSAPLEAVEVAAIGSTPKRPMPKPAKPPKKPTKPPPAKPKPPRPGQPSPPPPPPPPAPPGVGTDAPAVGTDQ